MGYTHGKKWADGEVEESIMNMVNTLKLDHFPTKAEMIEFYGNRSLAGKVSKSGCSSWDRDFEVVECKEIIDIESEEKQ